VHELENPSIIHFPAMPIQGWNAVAKRAMDVAGVLLLMPLFGIPMLILAFLVKATSRGPILLRQERIGLGGKKFTMLKFRSMHAEAEKQTGPVWTQKNDSRRTRLGVFMRRFSLDELPQLFNVLHGDMSLVGPRPERPHFLPELIHRFPHYMRRYDVKPGITGWAQVSGLRGNTSVEKRLLHDLYYINNWCLKFDFYILLLTPVAGLMDSNAY
jgi:exopolysaccharide biosynthesis polyprenyl glycosylphosphotransferase